MTEFGIISTTIALAVWVGAIVFQSAVVAPSVFSALASEDASRFLRRLFPRFFLAGLICGVVMLIGLVCIYAAGGWRPSLTLAAIVTGSMLAMQFVAGRMVPSINAARDAGEAGRQRFGRLHGINVLLTIAVLLLGLILLSGIAVATQDTDLLQESVNAYAD